MKVTRNGRLTEHTVMLDLAKAPVHTITKGTSRKLYPFRLTIKMQYLWSDGAWHVRDVKLTGYQNTQRRGEPFTVIFKNPESLPEWVKALLADHTPIPLATPEMIRQTVEVTA